MPDDTQPLEEASPDQRKAMEEKRAQWDKITQKRMELLQADKDRRAAKEAEEKARGIRENANFQKEVKEAKERSEDREAWRQEQHAKRNEESKHKKEILAIEEKLAVEKKKREALRAESKKEILELHKTAVAHKIRDQRTSIEHNEQVEIKSAVDMAERYTHTLDLETQNALSHLESERQRHTQLAHADSERRRKGIEEKARMAKMDTEKERSMQERAARQISDRMNATEAVNRTTHEAGQKKMHIESEMRRDLMTCDEELQNQLYKIDEETRRLKDEVVRNAGKKKDVILRNEERKKRESTQRKENFEKWLKDV